MTKTYIALALCSAWVAFAQVSNAQESQSSIVSLCEKQGVTGGLCVQVGSEDLAVALELGRTGRVLVEILETDAAKVERARKQIHSTGLYGLVSTNRWAEEEPIRNLLQNYCVKCHGPEKQKGDVRLDQLDYAITDHASLPAWQDVLDMLNTGKMPPEVEEQPSAEELAEAIGSITDNITSARKRLAATGGVITMRHLNRREYLGSMKDLFGIDLPRDVMPEDASDGFDTDGSEQFFSLKQYESFHKAGKGVVERHLTALTAIQLPPPAPEAVRYDPEIEPFTKAKTAHERLEKAKAMIDAGAPISELRKLDSNLADKAGIKIWLTQYKRFRSKTTLKKYESWKGKKGVNGGLSYTTASRPRSIYTVSIGAVETAGGEVDISVNGRRVGNVQLEAGKDRVSTELKFSTSLLDSQIRITVSGRKEDTFDYLKLTGPIEDTANEPSFFETVVGPVLSNSDPDEAEIVAMLKGFADRAFRYQEVDGEYIEELVNIYRTERSAGKEAAECLVHPLTAILTAPGFLYINEENDGSRGTLSQREFAIRMAYFLWGAPPDQELYDAAESGKLFDKAVLRAQVDRMLASGKADVFLADFINQWSDIKRFDEVDLPVKLIRSGFETSARQEISEFFKVLVRENRPVDNLIDSDFVVVNPILARYYRVKPGPGGFQKVALPESSTRGGMLTQAAFLIMGTSGPRTSPTIRGTIIRDRFLHDPPPPPSPNIPAIENPEGQRLSVRQLVDRHMNVAQCASCHKKIDPIGYGLERFDHLGGDRLAGRRIGPVQRRAIQEAASGHVDGDPFEGLKGLQQVLLKNKDRLARSMYESLLSYGIGRKIEFVDEKDIGENLGELEKQNYPLQEMIFAVIASKTFATK